MTQVFAEVSQQYSGNSNTIITFDDAQRGFAITNDGTSSLTFTINGNTYEVKKGESFDENFAPFITVAITTSVAYRAIGRKYVEATLPDVVIPPPPTVYAEDDFDRTDDPTGLGTAVLGGSWTNYGNPPVELLDGKVQSSGTNLGASSVTLDLSVTDHFLVTAEITSDTTLDAGGLLVRGDGTPDNAIILVLNGASGLSLQKVVSGTPTTIASYLTSGITNNQTYKLGLAVHGTSYEVYVDDVLLGTETITGYETNTKTGFFTARFVSTAKLVADNFLVVSN